MSSEWLKARQAAKWEQFKVEAFWAGVICALATVAFAFTHL